MKITQLDIIANQYELVIAGSALRLIDEMEKVMQYDQSVIETDFYIIHRTGGLPEVSRKEK